jgi:hypothetical protein
MRTANQTTNQIRFDEARKLDRFYSEDFLLGFFKQLFQVETKLN